MQPIACSLTSAEMPARLAEMAAIGQAALVAFDRDAHSLTLRFQASDTTRARLEAIVAAEAHCCSFLEMRLRDEASAIALEIATPAGAGPILDDFVKAFSAQSEAT
jgi:hypothetical protein